MTDETDAEVAGVRRAAEMVPREADLATREASLAAREAAVAAREQALLDRAAAAVAILAAADARDALSDSRDVGGDTREQHLERAYALARGTEPSSDLPLRRGAALDRDHAKDDRRASRADRIALTAEAPAPEVP